MSFTLILNSVNGTTLGPLSTNREQIVEFNVDWGALSKHKGKFSLTSSIETKGQTANITTNAVHTINADWGADGYYYKPTSDNGLNSSQTIGIIIPKTIGAGGVFGADEDDNVPVILLGLPTKNQFRISMITTANNTAPANFDADYALTLYFEAI